MYERIARVVRMLAAELLDLANTALSANDFPLLERLVRESES